MDNGIHAPAAEQASIIQEEFPMESGVTLLAELRTMKKKMDRVWGGPSEESAITEERGIWQWVEKLPKFQGTRKRSLKSRSNKTIKSK